MNADRFPIPPTPMIALAVAVIGIVTLLLVDHGPWNGPVVEVASKALAQSSAAELRAGATVTPTTVAPGYIVRR